MYTDKSAFYFSGGKQIVSQYDMFINHKIYRKTSGHILSLRQFYSNETISQCTRYFLFAQCRSTSSPLQPAITQQALMHFGFRLGSANRDAQGKNKEGKEYGQGLIPLILSLASHLNLAQFLRKELLVSQGSVPYFILLSSRNLPCPHCFQPNRSTMTFNSSGFLHYSCESPIHHLQSCNQFLIKFPNL